MEEGEGVIPDLSGQVIAAQAEGGLMDSGYQALWKDHEDILAMLKASGDSFSRSTGSVQSPDSPDYIEQCKALYAQLLDHFDREDHIVYFALREAVLTDHKVHEMLDEFDDDLLEITLAAKEFFSKCVPDKNQRMDHVRDYGIFYILLRDRFMREESDLFREYESITH